MMAAPLRVGVVGVGFGQAVTIPVFQACPDTTVVALCAQRLEKAREVGASLGVPAAYTDALEMVSKEQLDVLALAVPADVQVKILRDLTERGSQVAIFAEKPLTVSAEEARQLGQYWGQPGRRFAVDFEFPFIGVWQRFQEMLRERDLSQAQIEVRWTMQNYANRHRLQSWKTEGSRGGGVLHAFGSHVLYNVERFFGPAISLTSRLSKREGDPRPGATRWEAQLEMKSGGQVRVVVDSDDPDNLEHSFRVRSSAAELMLSNRTADYVRGFELLERQVPVPLSEPDLADWQKPFVENPDGRRYAVSLLVERVLRAWTTGDTSAIPTFADGLRVQELMEKVIESDSKNGEKIYV